MDVCFSIDKQQLIYLPTVIKSITRNINARTSSIVRFHLLTDELDLDCPLDRDLVEIKQLSAQDRDIILSNMRPSSHQANNLMNFARFYLPDYFDQVHSALYLDVDTLVQSDITELLGLVDLHTYALWAVANCEYKYTISPLLTPNFGDDGEYGFNAGVYYLDFDHWRHNFMTKSAIEIMAKNKLSHPPLYRLGTQPVMNVLYRQFGHLPVEWNLRGLPEKTPAEIESAKILHWSGPNKPWTDATVLHERWKLNYS